MRRNRPALFRNAIATAVVLTAAMRGTQLAFPLNVPRLPLPRFAFHKMTPRNQRRRQAVEAKRQAIEREKNRHGRLANRLKLLGFRDANKKEREHQRIVKVMTNHERNLWARAGYPKGAAFSQFAEKAKKRIALREMLA